ncbi:MAG: DUF3108 domain-containing protein [Pseudomonadales bacterium]
MRTLQRTFLYAMTVLLLAVSQVACTSTRLPPYEATYTTKLRGIKIKGVRKFESLGENNYRISWTAKALWMQLNEWSDFEIVDKKVRPVSYHYTRKGLGTDRPVHVYFDWASMRASGAKGDNTYEYELLPGVLDKLSYQVQMQLDLLANPRQRALSYTIANYSGLRDYRFDYTATETIDTRLGPRETLVYQREKKDSTIRLWIAPVQNYLPVKIEQEEDGDSNVVLIKSWESHSIAPQAQLSSRSRATDPAGPAAGEPFDDDF